MIPILNKIRKGDPNNATRWSSVVESTNAEIPAVQFMIDLCLRRRGWIPVFLECLAGTPNLFQIASTADALDAPVVHCVLRQCLETNIQPNADETATSFTELTEQQRLERYAKEICLLDLVERLFIGLSSTNGLHVMDPLSFVLYVLLPCLRVDHPSAILGVYNPISVIACGCSGFESFLHIACYEAPIDVAPDIGLSHHPLLADLLDDGVIGGCQFLARSGTGA